MYDQQAFRIPYGVAASATTLQYPIRRSPSTAAKKTYTQLFSDLPFQSFLSVLGATLFIGGALCQIPGRTAYDEKSCNLFLAGALFYIGAWGREARMEYDRGMIGSGCLFLMGPVCILFSSILNKPSVHRYNEALGLLFIGCALFGVRALYKCYQSLKAITQQRQSLMPVMLESAVALCYTLGCTFFLVADSLHLLHWRGQHDKSLMYRATGYMCVVGSIFFLLAALVECGRSMLPPEKKAYLQDSLLHYERAV